MKQPKCSLSPCCDEAVGWSTSAPDRLDQERVEKDQAKQETSAKIWEDLPTLATPGDWSKGFTDCWIAMDGQADVLLPSTQRTYHRLITQTFKHLFGNKQTHSPRPIDSPPWRQQACGGAGGDIFLGRIYNFGIWNSPDPTPQKCVQVGKIFWFTQMNTNISWLTFFLVLNLT